MCLFCGASYGIIERHATCYLEEMRVPQGAGFSKFKRDGVTKGRQGDRARGGEGERAICVAEHGQAMGEVGKIARERRVGAFTGWVGYCWCGLAEEHPSIR